MRLTIRSPKDFWAGIMFLAISMATVLIAQDYAMGTAGRMGPGFFPSILGWVLAAIGAITLIASFTTKGEPLEPLAYKDMVLILGAVLLFAFLVRGAGLVCAIPALILVSAFGSTRFRWKPALALAVGATVFCVLLFVKALGLPIPIVGPWLGA